jgi:nucleoside permease NupC
MVQGFVVIIGMSVLTYLGVIKYIVETLGRALSFCIGTSPSEGINAVGNMFLHVVRYDIDIDIHVHTCVHFYLLHTFIKVQIDLFKTDIKL